MENLFDRKKVKLRQLYGLPVASIAIGLVAVGLLFFLNDGFYWVFSGPHFAIASLSLLLVGTLGLAVYRRNQLLKLHAERVQKQGQEIELIYTALNRHALVSLTDSGGVITSVNENFSGRYGYLNSELVGKPISIIYPDGASDAVYRAARKSLVTGDIWSGENEEIAADGSRIYTRCTLVPVMDDHGNLVRTVEIRTDNTDFHRAEQARFLKALFDHLQDEVYIFCVESLDMVYANHAAIRASGWKAKDLVDKTVLDADPNMNEKYFRAHVAPLFSGEKEVVSIDVRRGETSGEISTRIVRGEDGNMLFVSVLRDSTERKQIERAKMESVSIVSHELRTPLTSIHGSLRLLNSGALGTFDPKAQSVLDIAVRNTDRLLLVVDDILDLEKFRAGKMPIEKVHVDLVSLVNEAVEINKGYGSDLHVSFAFETDLETAPIFVAPERMMQVLANLLSNAAKYSPTHGTVRVGLREDGRFWQISVADDGPGIPEEMRASVFESFSKLPSLDGVTRKGTGLGMTISQKIVQAHDGEIGFDSEVGNGSTFFIRLPMDLSRAADV
uniref:PAS domain-containing sensor histidine kinase n=1 Tax=Roseovarius sp. BRH_c41 TaxID=1629709 RepID=UPI000A90E0E7|nr:PAS domain-containing sensor histidine kinase [Roseovarius sp. BRH_c41]